MAWKGNTSKIPNSTSDVNIQPNPLQGGVNVSNIRRNKTQSRDSGEITRNIPGVGGIPKVGPYFKEHAVRRDTDLTKNFKVDLIDIDTTIMEFIDKRLDLFVTEGNEKIKVPILYASPERWYSVQKDGCLRDNQGKIILPLFLMKRTTVENNNQCMFLNRYLDYTITTQYTERNRYDRHDIINNKNNIINKPKQTYKIKIPDHVIINYDCIIWTDYVEQNNKILETINFATHDYWGIDRFKFRTRIGQYTNEIIADSTSDRNVRSSFALTVYAYLLPPTIDGVKDTTQKDTIQRALHTNITLDNEKTKKQKQIKSPYSHLSKYVGS